MFTDQLYECSMFFLPRTIDFNESFIVFFHQYFLFFFCIIRLIRIRSFWVYKSMVVLKSSSQFPWAFTMCAFVCRSNCCFRSMSRLLCLFVCNILQSIWALFVFHFIIHSVGFWYFWLSNKSSLFWARFAADLFESLSINMKLDWWVIFFIFIIIFLPLFVRCMLYLLISLVNSWFYI